MPTYSAGYADRPTWTLKIVATQSALNAVANTSLVSWSLRLYRGSTQEPFNNAGTPWSVSGPGGSSGTFPAYRFGSTGSGTNYSSVPVGGFVEIASGSETVAHNANGTKSVTFSGSHAAGATLGTATIGSNTFTLTTLTQAPGVPSTVALAYTSDTAANLSWVDTSASNGQPVTNQIQTSINGGTFTQVLSISAASSVVLANAANRKLVARVRATNTAGSSAYSASSNAVFTTPAAPTNVSAAKDSALDITVSWTPNVAYVEHQHVVEFSTNAGSTWTALATVAAGTSTFKHVAPNAALVHVYRVRAVTTASPTRSSANVVSNSVQLLAAPNAPTLASLAAFAARTLALVVPFTHNPVDTTGQTAYEMQFSTNGGSTWTSSGKVTSTVSSRTIAANTYTANTAVTIRVRTWGQATSGGADGTGASDWSATQTVTFKSRPTVSITTPADGSTWVESEMRVGVSFAQAEDGTFVSATLELREGTTVLESLESATLASTTFATAVDNGGTYNVRATVLSSHGLVSTQVTSTFSVAYTLPVQASVVVSYLSDSGVAQLDVSIGSAGSGEAAATAVTIFRKIDGVSETIVAGLPVSVGSLTILDTTPTINGVNEYRVRTLSAIGAARDTTTSLATSEGVWAFLSGGGGFAQIVRFFGGLTFTATHARKTTLVEAAGRRSPIALFGEGRDLQVTGSATLIAGQGSTPDEVEALLSNGGRVCYRDPSGRRMFGVVSGSLNARSSIRTDFSYTVTEAS